MNGIVEPILLDPLKHIYKIITQKDILNIIDYILFLKIKKDTKNAKSKLIHMIY